MCAVTKQNRKSASKLFYFFVESIWENTKQIQSTIGTLVPEVCYCGFAVKGGPQSPVVKKEEKSMQA